VTEKRVLKRVASLTVALALLVALSITAVAEEPTVTSLVADVASSGQLAGSAAGAFAYYQVDYTGNEETLDLKLAVAPWDPSFGNGIGVNVYAPDGSQATGEWVNEEGVIRLSYVAENPVTLLVQVYNYTEITVSYDLIASGAVAAAEEAAPAEEAPAEAVEEAAPAEEAPAEVAAEPLSVSGAFVGDRGGAYATHELGYAGDESDLAVTMYYWPVDPSFGRAFGMNIYSPSGALVATGEPTDVDGALSAVISSDEAGTYLVQVYNYTDGVLLTYTLTVSS